MADFDTRARAPEVGRTSILGIAQRGVIGGPTITTLKVVTLRAPQFGFTLADREDFLTQQLPNGVDRFIALFTTMPDRAGLGGIEALGGGYVRVAHQSWRGIVVANFIARRANVGAVVFPTLTDDLTVVGWGAFDAVLSGNIKAFGLLRNADGKARVFDLASGDDPTFLDGELQVGIQ